MNADAIVKRIEADGKEAATQILAEARQRAHRLRSESDQRVRTLRQTAVSKGQQEATELQDRMRRMGQLELKKALLFEKREVLDDAFQVALQRLNALPDAKARQWGLERMLVAANGTETIVADSASPWVDAQFVKAANTALIEKGKQGKLTLAPEKRAMGGGFALVKGGMQILVTFPEEMSSVRSQLEPELSALLFK